MSRSTSSTAESQLWGRPNRSRLTGKRFESPRRESRGSLAGEGGGICAAELMAGGDASEVGVEGATLDAVRAAWGEAAAGGELVELGHAAGDDGEVLASRRQARHAAQKALRVGVLGVVEDRGDRAVLDDLPGIHDRHAVGDLVDDRQVVGDQQDAHPELVAKPGDELEDLRL